MTRRHSKSDSSGAGKRTPADGRSRPGRGKPAQAPGAAPGAPARGRDGGKTNAKPPAKRPSQPSRPPAPVRSLAVDEPGPLLAFLLAKLTRDGRNAIKSMLARGQIAVDGVRTTAYDYPLRTGQTVTVSKERVPEATSFAGMAILHEDEDIIVIRKDAGLLSVATDEGGEEPTAYRQLTEHVRARDPRARIFVLHRLDRDTSGVMMFAKNERAKLHMQDNWKDVVKERLYVALVEGEVKQAEGTVSSWLKENAAMKMYSSPHPNDGQHAITHYRTLRTGRAYSLLEVRLDTGRKNQIRVHMADLGHPIAGDKKYGARTRPIGRLGLHASVLSFVHPTTGELLRFEATVPRAFASVFRD